MKTLSKLGALTVLFLLGSTSTEEVKVSAITQFHIKGVWRSGRVVDCNPEGCGIESRWCYFWWFIRRKVDGKLSEKSFAGEQKTVRKFRWFRNIPCSSSELVGFTRSSCRKSFPSPLQVSLLHPVRLAEFSVNFFFSVGTRWERAIWRKVPRICLIVNPFLKLAIVKNGSCNSNKMTRKAIGWPKR